MWRSRQSRGRSPSTLPGADQYPDLASLRARWTQFESEFLSYVNGLSAAVCYYGGQIAKNADEKPKVPTQMHFGDKDASIPMSDVETIKKKRGGDSEIYVYPDAQHGFHCDERGSFHDASAKTAWQRAMDFLKKHLKK